MFDFSLNFIAVMLARTRMRTGRWPLAFSR